MVPVSSYAGHTHDDQKIIHTRGNDWINERLIHFDAYEGENDERKEKINRKIKKDKATTKKQGDK